MATRRFQEALKEDRRYRVRKAGEEIETLVESAQTREVWINIQRWYLQEKGHPTPPTREGLEHDSTLREDLYRRRPPEGEAIPILVQPVSITYGPPEGEYIIVTVRRLCLVQGRGLPGMLAENFKAWIRETTIEKYPNTEHWDKLAIITKLAFRDRHIPEELEWTTMVLINNSGGV